MLVHKTHSHTILQNFDLRVTDCRIQVLDFFLSENIALSNADIEEAVSSSFDRVTIYRTLKTFLNKGLIHKVLDDSGNLKYAICKEKCTQEDHNHQHIHFNCVNCGKTCCLEDIEIPKVKLPQGYTFQESNLLVKGFCEECNTH